MRHTQDLVLARLRLAAQRWQGDAASERDYPNADYPNADYPNADYPDTRDSVGDDDLLEYDTSVPRPVSGRSDALGATDRPSAEDEPWPPARLWVRLIGAVCALGVVGALVALLVAWPRQDTAGFAPQAAASSAPHQANPSEDPFAGAFAGGEASPSAAAWLLIHVAGRVRDPGVVRLPPGSRVNDALEAAGGLRRGGKVGSTNLARLLTDGERIEIGAKSPAAETDPGSADPGSADPGSAGTGSAGMGSTPPTPVDLNTATMQQLDELPGIGPVTAGKILAWRSANGRFTMVDELAEVSGIGPRTLAELRPLVRV